MPDLRVHRAGWSITIALILGASLLVAQSTPSSTVPRLADGRPDLNGVWSFATLTPLERPAELDGKATLSSDEAAAIEKRTLEV